MTTHILDPQADPARTTKQLELFALRALDFADRVAAGEIRFLDAIDVTYDAAITAGLVDAVGDDVVQEVLAAAFASSQRQP
jgi:hypothetical protein